MDTSLLARDDADALLGTASPQPVKKTSQVENYNPKNLVEERALELLGDAGLGTAIVAKTLGVTPARISQLLADPTFAEEVRRRRIIEIQKYAKRDQKVDRIEDKLLDKLEKALPLMHKTGEILNAVRVMTGIKRHTSLDPTDTDTSGDMVQIQLPAIAAKSFTVRVDINNNVIQAGDQSLITAPMSGVVKRARPGDDVVDVAVRKEIKHENPRSPNQVSEPLRLGQTVAGSGHELSEDDI